MSTGLTMPYETEFGVLHRGLGWGWEATQSSELEGPEANNEAAKTQELDSQ